MAVISFAGKRLDILYVRGSNFGMAITATLKDANKTPIDYTQAEVTALIQDASTGEILETLDVQVIFNVIVISMTITKSLGIPEKNTVWSLVERWPDGRVRSPLYGKLYSPRKPVE
jgi:hypothetical protein